MDELKDLVTAIHLGHADTITRYLKAGGDPNAQYGMPLLSHAVDAGKSDIVDILLKAKAYSNYGGRSGKLPMYMAAKNVRPGNLEIVKMLIDNHGDVNQKYMNGNTPLLEATWLNNFEIVELLIKAGANVLAANNGGDTGLHMAALKGNTRCLDLFLKAGVPANVIKFQGPKHVSNTGVRPLHLTVFGPNGGHARVAEHLISAGADVDARESNGRTTLHLAAMRNAYLVADVLLAHGCDINPISMENEEHKTPLMKAVDSGHTVMVKKLIRSGADLEMRDVWGLTPLITAAFNGKAEIVMLLLQAGCDVNKCSKNGMSALTASLRNPPHVTEMLVVAGCRLTPSFRSTLLAGDDFSLRDHPDVYQWLLWQTENPRMLQQICRVVIRSRVIASHSTPFSPESFGVLPKDIVNYLQHNDLNDILRRYNISLST